MPRQLTKPEVIRRIAMRALLDAVPSMTHARLVASCHASYTTVHDAASHDISHWLSVLETAPDPRPNRATRLPPDRQASRVPSNQVLQHSRPGDRHHARLVEPDAADQVMSPEENAGVDIEPSDAGWQDDRNRVIVDPLDNPIPRKRKKSHEKDEDV